MTSAWLNDITTWVSAHPVAAGGVIFLISFLEGIVAVGIVVPALPLLFGIGTLIGLGHINGPYAVACAAAGAFAGDALSFWIGHRWGTTLRNHWPFRRYPQLIDRGERLFRKHGSKGIVIARFVGAVRPFVPAVAGMLHMPLKRYVPASAFAAVAWALAFLAPGWLFGASYHAIAAVADRLALVLLALIAALALVWFLVLFCWRHFAGQTDRLLARALKWGREHPVLGRYTVSLIDPQRPESPSLAMLALCLLLLGWGGFGLMALILAKGGPLAIDHRVHALMETLRNPLADHLLAALASIGDLAVVLPAMAAGIGWLLWRRRFEAVLHWLAALAFGFLFTAFIGLTVQMPMPPGATRGFGFPSIPITLLTIVLGFFSLLIAREMPGRQRVWPYLLSGAIVTLLGFARLYFGAHWLSDIVGGILFGLLWLLVLGIAYRRRVRRSFWMRPLAGLFYATFAVAACWHAPRAAPDVLAQFESPQAARMIDAATWWTTDWRTLPAHRDERTARGDAEHGGPLDLQIAGSLDAIRARFEAAGWRTQAQASWIEVLGLLDPKRALPDQPVLPATLDARAEALLLRAPGPTRTTERVLRLWRAPATLSDGRPLWLGSAQTMRFARPVQTFGVWVPVDDHGAAHARVRAALTGLDQAEAAHPDGALSVLRVRLDAHCATAADCGPTTTP